MEEAAHGEGVELGELSEQELVRRFREAGQATVNDRRDP
jgi:hypothetical protein